MTGGGPLGLLAEEGMGDPLLGPLGNAEGLEFRSRLARNSPAGTLEMASLMTRSMMVMVSRRIWKEIERELILSIQNTKCSYLISGDFSYFLQIQRLFLKII